MSTADRLLKSCPHLGVVKGDASCNTCGHLEVIKVYECAKHGLTTLRTYKTNQPEAACWSCDESPFVQAMKS